MDRARRKAWWTPFGLALLCGHCALGGVLLGASALGLATLPTLGGVSLAYVLPPVLIVGGFGAWLWSGQRAAAREACALPGAGEAADAEGRA